MKNISYNVTREINTEVLVAGGGVAGCAAALSAARCGAKVILLESGGTLVDNFSIIPAYKVQYVNAKGESIDVAFYNPMKADTEEVFLETTYTPPHSLGYGSERLPSPFVSPPHESSRIDVNTTGLASVPFATSVP